MANVSQLQPALTPQVQTSSIQAAEKQADFLALRLINKRARLRLSPEPLDLTSFPGKAGLFAIVNSKGWFAAVTRETGNASALVLSPLTELRSALASIPAEDEQPFRPQRRIPITGAPPHILTFACNDTRALLGLLDGSIHVYASDHLFSTGDGPVQPIHVFAASSSAPLLSIQPNPADIPELIAVLRDCVNSPGSLAVELLDVQKLTSSGGWVAGKLPSTTPTAISWSPRGKQLALGLQNGDIVTFSPFVTATPKSSVPCPPSAGNVRVLSVHWLSTTSFYTIYAPPGPLVPDAEQFHFHISLDSKSNSMQDIKFNSPYLPYPGIRPPGDFVVRLHDWDPTRLLFFVGDSTSSDIGLIGCMPGDSGEIWLNLSLEETSTPSLPLDGNQDDTVLLGIDVDLTSTDSYRHCTASGEALDLPAHPIMYVYASDGTILGWHILNVTGTSYPGMVTTANTSTPAPVGPSSMARELSSDAEMSPPTFAGPAPAPLTDAFSNLQMAPSPAPPETSPPAPMFGSPASGPSTGVFGSFQMTSAVTSATETTSSVFANPSPAPSTNSFNNLQTPSTFFKPASGFFSELPKESAFFAPPKQIEPKLVSAFSPSTTQSSTLPQPPGQPMFGTSSMPGGGAFKSAFTPVAPSSTQPPPSGGAFSAFASGGGGFAAFSSGGNKTFADLLRSNGQDKSPKMEPSDAAQTTSVFGSSSPGPSAGAFSNLQTTPSTFVKPASGFFGEFPKESPFFAPPKQQPVSAFALSATPSSTPPKSTSQPTFGTSSMPGGAFKSAFTQPTVVVPSTTTPAQPPPGSGAFGAFAGGGGGFTAFASGGNKSFGDLLHSSGQNDSPSKPSDAASVKPAESSPQPSAAAPAATTPAQPPHSDGAFSAFASGGGFATFTSGGNKSDLLRSDGQDKPSDVTPMKPSPQHSVSTGSSIISSDATPAQPPPDNGAFSAFAGGGGGFTAFTSGKSQSFVDLLHSSGQDKPSVVQPPDVTPMKPAQSAVVPLATTPAQPPLSSGASGGGNTPEPSDVERAQSSPLPSTGNGGSVSVFSLGGNKSLNDIPRSGGQDKPPTPEPSEVTRLTNEVDEEEPDLIEDEEDETGDVEDNDSEYIPSDISESEVSEEGEEESEGLSEEGNVEREKTAAPVTTTPMTEPFKVSLPASPPPQISSVLTSRASPARELSTTPPESPVKDAPSPVPIHVPPMKPSPLTTPPFSLTPRPNNRPVRSSPLANAPLVLDSEAEKLPFTSKSAPPALFTQPTAPKASPFFPISGEKPAGSFFTPASTPPPASPFMSMAPFVTSPFPSFAPGPSQPSAFSKVVPAPAPTPSPTPEQGMQTECLLLVTSLAKELESLGQLATRTSLKSAELQKTSGFVHQKADLGNPQKWNFGDIKEFGKVLVEVQMDIKELKLERVSLRKALRELDSNILKVNTRKEEIARFDKAKSDPEFAKMLKIRTLAPEYAEAQSKLRKSIRTIRDRVQKLEDHLHSSKKRINEIRTGRPSIKPPSLDTVNRAFRNIDVAIDRQKGEVCHLQQRVAKLEISGEVGARNQIAVSSSERSLNVTPNVAVTTAAALNAERSAQKLKRALLACRTQPLLNTTATASPVATSFQTPQKGVAIKPESKTPEINVSQAVFTLPAAPMSFPSSLPDWSPPPPSSFGTPVHDITPSRSRGASKHHQKPIAFKGNGSPSPSASPAQSSSFGWGPLENIKPVSQLPFAIRPAGSG